MNLLDLTENPRDLGLLSLGLRLMSTPGKFGSALGQAGMGALQDVQQAQASMDARKMRGLQQQMLEQQLASAKAQQEEAARQRQGRMSYLDSIDPNAGPAMPPSLVGAMRAGFSQDEAKGFMPAKPENQFSKVDPKDYTPESVAIFARTGNYADLAPRNKREFVNGQAVDPYATPPGTVIPPQANPATDLLVLGANGKWEPNVPLVNVKKEIGKAGATTFGLPKIDIKVGEGVAGQVGPMLKETRAQALDGIKLVDSANRILEAADQGNLYAGPAANLRLKGAQVADVLGFGGKDTKEKIANTRTVVRAMAEQGVAARSQLGGQAQISNAEQELLTRATSGDIADLTTGEIIQIAKLNDRLGRQLYERHNQSMSGLKNTPNTQNLVPFFQVPDLPAPFVPKKPSAPTFLGFEPQ